MDPAALASLPLEKATKMELKRGQVLSGKTKVHIAQIQVYSSLLIG